jgi:signal transduction histidine kinase
MAAVPGRSIDEAADSNGFGPSAFEHSLNAALERSVPTRWLHWRRRFLVLAGLLGGIGLFVWMGWLARSPFYELRLLAEPGGPVLLAEQSHSRLAPYAGAELRSLRAADGSQWIVSDALLQRSPRWTVDDSERARQEGAQAWLGRALKLGPLTLDLSDGQSLSLPPQERGFRHLGWALWPLAVLALVLWLVAAALLLLRWRARNLLYMLMALSQAASLLAGAMQSLPGLGLPAGWAALDFPLRLSLDLITAAAVLHAAAVHPVRVPFAPRVAALAWLTVGVASTALWLRAAPWAWWWGQAAVLVLSLGALLVLTLAYRVQPHPFVVLLRRFGFAAVGSLLLLWVVALSQYLLQGLQLNAVHAGALMWTVFFASILLLLPFLSRSRQAMREFALLAGVSTVATSLDLLFVAVFSFGQFTSLALAVFLALAVYAAARQWIVNQMSGSRTLTIERTFEQLYRVAREVEAQPARQPALLTQLLRELFDPLEVLRVAKSSRGVRVIGDGAALVVPLGQQAGGPQSLVLRFAQRGRRIFSAEDARLTERVLEQLRRAVAYDKAVEQGRSEERQRIAQDLHDDIGARLLTLMYQAQTPEMEEYVRHTLQDLKTLTRGLAAREHRFSHAIAEWKADLTQRLAAAQIELRWQAHWDRDIRLTVVQWSALTRVLRELATNILAHAQASQVEVSWNLQGGALNLRVADDGCGRAPDTWSHGLGLGGVRKRVKQLDGTVRWAELQPRGIVCTVSVPRLTDSR